MSCPVSLNAAYAEAPPQIAVSGDALVQVTSDKILVNLGDLAIRGSVRITF